MADRSRLARWSASAALVVAWACAPGEAADPWGPRLSDAGIYRVALRPQGGEIPLGRLHAWIFHVESLDGAPFAPSRLSVGGGMPQHGHGFVTEPRVTRSLGEGDFLVEGMKFHMAGEWTLRFEIAGPAGGDVATYRVQVGP